MAAASTAAQRNKRRGRVQNRQALAWIQKNFQLTEALLDADPTNPGTGYSLREAFSDIRSQGIVDPGRAAQILAKTTWYQSYGIDALKRLSEGKRKNYWHNSQGTGVIDQKMNEIRDEYMAAGINIPGPALRQIAQDAYVYGLSPATLQKQLAGKATIDDGTTAEEQLRDLADSLGVSSQHDANYFRNAALKIQLKQASADSYKQTLQNEAIATTPYWAEQIKSGQTVRELASPYLNSARMLLEDDTIDLNHDLVSKALTSVDANGVVKPLSLWDFKKSVMKDARWKNTENGQNAYATIGTGILRAFGFRE